MKKLFHELMHFGIIGVFNTLLGMVLIMVFYNIWHWNYWVASGTSYVIGIAKPLVKSLMNGLFPGVARQIGDMIHMEAYAVEENVAILVGMGLFIIFNFIGQKFFVFTRTEKGKE